MRALLTLNDDFHPDTSIDATVTVEVAGMLTGRVIIQFNADGNKGQHRILTDFAYQNQIPHYSQAQAICQASFMVDSHFTKEDSYFEIEGDI